ncbi:MAG: radical SAM protein [Candidatus Omnitrophica bacterium]|nr:radical SAM protein [Candidatus Omnitrophota bacterium]MDD5690512.1 radical SAM protein [Candidatus Omnitrophota bacterium]
MGKDKMELSLSLNNTCNLRCRMCRIWNSGEEENKLTLEKCQGVIDELGAFEVKGVRLSGGDPLLVPWVLDLAGYINKKKYHSCATTNGSMINEAYALKIVSSGLSNLNISLDSYTPGIHDTIRGLPGGRDRIMDAIGHIAKKGSGPEIGINTVISNFNLDDLLILADAIQDDKRINHLYFMAIMQPFNTPPDKGWFLKEDFRGLWPEDKDKVRYVINELIARKKSGYKINNSFAQLRAFVDYFLDPLHFARKNTCNLGKEVMEVNQMGDVFLCHLYESIGNVFQDSLSNIWGSEKARLVRDKINRCSQNCNLLINCYFEEEDV